MDHKQNQPALSVKEPCYRCACGRLIPINEITNKQLISPRTTAFHETVSSSRLPHISARRLIEKAERYGHIDGPCKTLMDDVCDFTPGQNGFSVEKNAE
ncbi:39913_t:CDS:2 [Gigaspora margarita]|uniref:Uncharacterized protein n=2 Tax=Gigaspora margarita TaxID=4874 RepID=A0A8H3WVL0_GIGMA|nr:hypothetical protein F8M41_014659 [Gigaspora margarita]CAG8828251.1 39913_t:CDS:2 [Gigaspora margarita]